MNARRAAVAGLVLIAGGATWWAVDQPVVDAPPVGREAPAPPIARAVAVPRLAPEGDPPPVPAPPPPPAPREAVYSMSTFYLDEHNQVGVVQRSDDAFQRACRREAEACATHELFWGAAPSMIELTLSSSGTRAIVTGLGAMRRGGTPGFMACFERSMKAAALEAWPDMTASRTCIIRDLRQPLNDVDELAGRVGACLGPSTAVTSVTLLWDLVVEGSRVEVRDLEITSQGGLDGLAARCIEQAGSPPGVRFTADTRPRFERRRIGLKVVTNGAGPEAADEGKVRLAPLPPLPEAPLTDAQRVLGESQTEAILAARKEGKLEEVVALSARCIEAVPRFAPCYRLYASAAASLAGRSGSMGTRSAAKRAYERYLEVAPPGDEYVERVRAILGLSDAGR